MRRGLVWGKGRCFLSDTGRGLLSLKVILKSKNWFFEKPMYNFLVVVNRDHSSKYACIASRVKKNNEYSSDVSLMAALS